MSRQIFTIARIIITLLLFLIFFYWIPISDLVVIFSRIQLMPFLFSFVLSTVVFFLSAWKVQICLKKLEEPHGFWEVARAYYVGKFFNNFIPSSVGGDIAKGVELKRSRETGITNITLSIFAERFSGILALALFGTYFLLFQPSFFRTVGFGISSAGRFWLLILTLIGGIMIPLSMYIPPRNDQEERSYYMTKFRTILEFPYNYPFLSGILLIASLVLHALRSIVFFLLVISLGTSISITKILFILPIIAFVSFLPISLGGLGVKEGIITFCLQAFGLPVEISFGVSLLHRGLAIINSSIGGFFHLVGKGNFN